MTENTLIENPPIRKTAQLRASMSILVLAYRLAWFKAPVIVRLALNSADLNEPREHSAQAVRNTSEA